MSVSIATSQTISGDTFYRNKGFDISFSVVNTVGVDTSLYFANSEPGPLRYVDGNRFVSPTGIPSTGFLGTLSVDVLSSNPRIVSSITPRSYLGTVGVCTDPSGNVYFAHANGNKIYKIDLSGAITTFAGTGVAGDTEGDRLTAQFRSPAFVINDGSGTFYVTDNYRVRKIDASGSVSTIAGTSAQGYVNATGTSARFFLPSVMAIRPNGDLLVSESDYHAIRNVTLPGGVVSTYAGVPGAAGYVDGSLGDARMYFPFGLLYDPAGTLYIADQYNNRVRKVAAGTNTMTTFAGTGADSAANGTLTTAGMARASILARDSAGTIYVGSQERHTIQAISGSNVSLLAGAYFTAGYVDGAPLTARFNGIAGLAAFGNALYIGEVYNADVRKLTLLPNVRDANRPPGYTIIATSNYPITVNSRIDPSWTSVGGSLPLFKYEPFNNTFRARVGGDTLAYSAQSSTELAGYLTGAGTSLAAFRGTNGATTAYSYPLTLSVQALSGTTVVDDISTSVTINPSRIIVTPCNTNLVFYRNEPVTPVLFSLESTDVSSIFSTTSLPNGLTLVSNARRSFALRGTPLVQSLASNYTIVGRDVSGRNYSTAVSMVVNPERLILDVDGSTTIGNVLDTEPITPVTFTARFPPYTSNRSMRYTWSQPPPGGIQFRDICGNVQTGLSYTVNSSNDSTFRLTLAGTIMESQVRTFASNGTKTYTISLVGARTSPLPSLSPSLPTTLTFTMGQVILFDPSVTTAFVGIRTSNWSYSAKSYFGTDVSIATIAVTEGFLPDGLDVSFSSNLQRLDVSGTPTTLGTYPFTLTATTVGGGLSTSAPFSITTVNDVVRFTSFPTDTCFNFIQYRDLSNAKSGYYTSNLVYTARADSGRAVTITSSTLPDGVTIDAAGSSTFRLTGRPTTAAGVSTATLTAFVADSGATSNTTFTYLVSPDTFRFTPTDVSVGSTFTFAQNIGTTSVQLSATTLSENPILRYSSSDLPPALTITNTGLITGTPQGSVDSSFTVAAFTAYSSGSQRYSYSITDDAVLLQPSVYTTTTAPGGNVSIPITGYSLSALTVSNYRFSNTFPYGLTVNPTTGLLSGTLSSTLPRDVCFTLIGSAGIVDGSLNGVMHTDNLTVNRAVMVDMNYLNSTMYMQFSDNNGLSWQVVYSQSNQGAYYVGTNGSNVYMVPTSVGTVLWSSNGSSYQTRTVDVSSTKLTAITNKPGTSTWWIGGTLSNEGVRTSVVFKTTNDGLTWNPGTPITTNEFTDRGGNLIPYTQVGFGALSLDSYIQGGCVLAYKDDVLLLGGNQVLRSVDDGASWSEVSSGLVEVAALSVDHETVWIATGSDTYKTYVNYTYSTPATTIVYSTDQGQTWSPATGAANVTTFSVKHGLGAWIAAGVQWSGTSFTGVTRYSMDGVNWGSLPLPVYDYGPSYELYAPGVYNDIGFDETEWKILYTDDVSDKVILYSHPFDTPLTSGWTSNDITPNLSNVGVFTRLTSYVAQTIDPGADITTITFPFPDTGPTFVSPAQSTYLVWQYMPVPPITFTAVGSGISYFVSALPVGLTWNAETHSVSGAPMRTGTQTFTVYAKNSGLSAFTVTFVVEVPRIIKQQSGAGGYTSLLRQYTEVNAAQNARDSHVLPTESRTLGEFASPYPPSVITPSNCPC
jgi:hypothetical protein